MAAGCCTILILGHLPSADNLNGLRSRDTTIDGPVALRWEQQIRGAVPLLRCFGRLVRAMYCPTTIRHAESARLLARALDISAPVPDKRLNNIDYGIYKGRPLDDTPSRLDSLHKPYEEGESWEAVASRWREFCAEVLPAHDGELVLFAGQSGLATRMLRHVCGGVALSDALNEAAPKIPFFSAHQDFSPNGLVWRYRWNA